jgi:hypothetical protein
MHLDAAVRVKRDLICRPETIGAADPPETKRQGQCLVDVDTLLGLLPGLVGKSIRTWTPPSWLNQGGRANTDPPNPPKTPTLCAKRAPPPGA